MERLRKVWIVVALWICADASALGDALSLSGYLEQVESGHLAVKASGESRLGASSRAEEASVSLAPVLSSSATWLEDRKETANPAFQGDMTQATSFNVGVGMMSTIGTSAKLTYTMTKSKVSGANPQFVPGEAMYEVRPAIEISQPLWRNFGGHETSLQQSAGQTAARATEQQERYRVRMILLEAEMAYLRLALARESLRMVQENLSHARKMRAWNQSRVDQGLTDTGEVLQTDALVKMRELEEQGAKDEEATAARIFNLHRGRSEGVVAETLEVIARGEVPSAPPRRGIRHDVVAAQEARQLAEVQSNMVREKFRPSVEIFGSIALNGRDASTGSATSEGFGTDHPTSMLGLRVSAVVGREAIGALQRAASHEMQAAALNAEQRRFEADRVWEDLSARYEAARGRLRMAQTVEEAQKAKLEHERQRQRVGRATTAQVILFEQDYANAQLSRLRASGDVWATVAQMRAQSTDDRAAGGLGL